MPLPDTINSPTAWIGPDIAAQADEWTTKLSACAQTAFAAFVAVYSR
jgi:hypothetical protein